jgi:hypothetical protein
MKKTMNDLINKEDNDTIKHFEEKTKQFFNSEEGKKAKAELVCLSVKSKDGITALAQSLYNSDNLFESISEVLLSLKDFLSLKDLQLLFLQVLSEKLNELKNEKTKKLSVDDFVNEFMKENFKQKELLKNIEDQKIYDAWDKALKENLNE